MAGRLMRRTSPSTRIIGGRPADRCKSDAPCLALKASSSVISMELPDYGQTGRIAANEAAGEVMSTIATNIAKVALRIREAAQNSARESGHIGLLAVSKTQPASAVREAAAAGVQDFGENYLQEALEKQQALQDLPLRWHFIGPIQSNKTRAIAEHFDWVHSVDRLKIAQRLSEQRPAGLPPLNICLQVNISQ